MFRKAIAASLIAVSLLTTGCMLSMDPEDRFASSYCGDYKNAKVVFDEESGTDVHRYTDSEYGFKYTVTAVHYSHKMQDFDYYESGVNYATDFDRKYLENFLENTDYSKIKKKYDLEVSVILQSDIWELTEKQTRLHDFDAAADLILIRTDKELSSDDEKKIFKFFTSAMEKYDTREHFIESFDYLKHHVHLSLRMMIISTPHIEDVAEGKNYKVKYYIYGKTEDGD